MKTKEVRLVLEVAYDSVMACAKGLRRLIEMLEAKEEIGQCEG